MSSDAYLNQVSPYLLDRFKKYPALVDLFCNAWKLKEQINSGIEPWVAIQEMQDEYADLMQGYYEFQLQPTDFEHIKADIPLILAESRFPTFNLGTRSAVGGGWDSLHIFLAGTREPNPSFLVNQDKSISSYLFVNLVGGGQEIGNDLGYGKPRFFEAEAVKEISKALKEIDKDNFQRRWQFISDMNGFSTTVMTDEDVTDFVEFLRDLRKYLKDAVEEGDALLLTVN
ncbi:MAG: YfbM family protein [Myxacorys californica WJT36-NPBG1]|jgi:hypothetical protein|nr:YfbM family protein [Myxacorys californica WJT36-NPBG1]